MTVKFSKTSCCMIVIFLAAVLFTGCNGGSYAIRSGSINIYNDFMDGEYKSFSGYFYKELELEKGEIVRFCLDEKTSCGNLSFGLEDGEGNRIAEIKDGFILEVPESGSYRIFAQGEKHEGEFCLSWIAEPDGDPYESVEMDDVESFIYGKINGTMTSAEEIEALHQLQFVDWAEFSALGQEPVIDLLDWLYGLDDEKKLKRLSYILLIDGLDGAYAEYYEAIVGELFLKDPERFVLSLKCIEETDMERTIMFVNNYLKYADENGYSEILEKLGEEDPDAMKIMDKLLNY